MSRARPNLSGTSSTIFTSRLWTRYRIRCTAKQVLLLVLHCIMCVALRQHRVAAYEPSNSQHGGRVSWSPPPPLPLHYQRVPCFPPPCSSCMVWYVWVCRVKWACSRWSGWPQLFSSTHTRTTSRPTIPMVTGPWWGTSIYTIPIVTWSLF